MGPRGSGKTVLLRAVADAAEEAGWVSVAVTAKQGMLAEIIELIGARADHVLTPESRSIITSVRFGPVAVGRELSYVDPSWRFKLMQIVGELNEQGIGLLVTIDEVDPFCDELIEFIDIFQHFVSEDRDVAMLLGGLPSQVSTLFMDKHVSFVRRSFQRSLTSIPIVEVEAAIQRTIRENGREITPGALVLAAESTGGFAFAIQLMGYYLWRDSDPDAPMGEEDVRRAVRRSQGELERSVFTPTLRDLTNREEQYLRAMALDDGPSSTSDVAKRMDISMTNASNLRRRLLEHGLIREVRMGQVEFDMPLIQAYLQGCA